MGKTFKEQFVEALKDGKEDKAIFLTQFMKNEINEPYDYRSPLVWAKRYGNEKVIKALSDMGADEVVDKEGMGKELLKILDAEDIDEIDEKRAIELIKDGANIEKKDGDGNTALMNASANGHVKVVKALLDAGAEVDEKDKWNGTALMYASANGHVEVAKALIDAGAKVDEKDNNGNTALILASSYGHVEVVKALLDAGAEVDEKNERGYTALIWASQYGHVEVAKALLDAGADVTITKNDGYTAIDCTINDEIKKLLNEAMERKEEKARVEETTQETSENDVWSKIGKIFGREER